MAWKWTLLVVWMVLTFIGPPMVTATDPGTTPETNVTTTESTNVTATPSANVTATPSANVTITPSINVTTTPSTTVTTTPSTTITTKPDPCQLNPCGDGSTCELRENGTTTCLCQPGDSYDKVSHACVKAKVFPGEVNLQRDYTDELDDKTSKDFKELEDELCTDISKLFKAAELKAGDCVVEKFQRANSRSRSTSKVTAIYQLFFEDTSTITTDQVKTTLEKDCTTCSLIKDTEFTQISLCDRGACDKTSTDCHSKDGDRECSCKEGFLKTTLSDRVCLAACPEGEYATDKDCKPCSFGRSGFNCKESWKLALVIVGSVFGGLLLATSIGLIIVAIKPSKKGSKKAKHSWTGKPFPAKDLLVNSTNGKLNMGNVPHKVEAPFPDLGVPRIPRAMTNSGWDSRTNLEMTPSNSRQNLVPSGKNSRLYEEHNEMNPHSRPQNGYAQARPNNPYVQNQTNTNPYAQNQGRTNPYYMDDDRRRY